MTYMYIVYTQLSFTNSNVHVSCTLNIQEYAYAHVHVHYDACRTEIQHEHVLSW